MKKCFYMMLLLTVALASCKKEEHKDLKEGLYAEIETSKGSILLELEYQKTPVTVANFVSLAEGKNKLTDKAYQGKPFYDGLKFHRVLADFMIQGGDPLGTGEGGTGYKFKDEITDLVHDKAGILSMANSGPNTNSSQFFITHKETPWLNGLHTVFGHVLKGQDVVNKIAQNDAINSVKIIRIGETAKRFDAAKIFSDYFTQELKNQKEQSQHSLQDKKLYSEKYKAVFDQKLAEFANNRKGAQKTGSGVEYKILLKGNGKKPELGQRVFMNYSAYFENGEMLDSNDEAVAKQYGKFDPNRANQGGYRPVPVAFGKQLVPGLNEGMRVMTFGEKVLFFVPSDLAYGPQGANNGVIPPNANLIFELQIVENPGDTNQK